MVSACSSASKKATVGLTHVSTRKYLKPLDNDAILEVGMELGLDFNRLTNMKSSKYFLDEVVRSWLRQDDDVSETSGTPSWDSLIKALKAASFNGVASNIREGMYFFFTCIMDDYM